MTLVFTLIVHGPLLSGAAIGTLPVVVITVRRKAGTRRVRHLPPHEPPLTNQPLTNQPPTNQPLTNQRSVAGRGCR
jgi:hypothetical protein